MASRRNLFPVTEDVFCDLISFSGNLSDSSLGDNKDDDQNFILDNERGQSQLKFKLKQVILNIHNFSSC